MTKTIAFALMITAAAQAAGAQSFVFPPPAVAPAPVPAPMPPAPMAAPQPAPAPAPPAPPSVAIEPHFPFASVEPFAPFEIAPTISIDPQWVRDRALEAVGQRLGDLSFAFAQSDKNRPIPNPPSPPKFGGPRNEEGAYEQARNFIERDQYERALEALDRVIEMKGTRADAAMYWKGYSLSKLTRRPEALTTLSELQKQFPGSPWVRDARALEVEVRQASGQSVSASGADDQTKVLILRGLMQSDPETTLPVIEQLLEGNSSVRVKQNALIVLSQSRSARARQIIADIATKNPNPDLRYAAIRHLGTRPDTESQKVLSDAYGSTTDTATKRYILRSLMSGNARDKLLAIAKSEKSPELRSEAARQLGNIRGTTELEELYRTETDKAVKQQILQSLGAAQATQLLGQVARSERDPELQRMAIRSLGMTNRAESAEALRSIYTSDVPVETKQAVIEGLAMHQNASILVALAKAERNPELKNDIVRRLSTMAGRSPEARDYMLELLK
jgi:tetratricopeptide (TPR) repeat protein